MQMHNSEKQPLTMHLTLQKRPGSMRSRKRERTRLRSRRQTWLRLTQLLRTQDSQSWIRQWRSMVQAILRQRMLCRPRVPLTLELQTRRQSNSGTIRALALQTTLSQKASRWCRKILLRRKMQGFQLSPQAPRAGQTRHPLKQCHRQESHHPTTTVTTTATTASARSITIEADGEGEGIKAISEAAGVVDQEATAEAEAGLGEMASEAVDEVEAATVAAADVRIRIRTQSRPRNSLLLSLSGN